MTTIVREIDGLEVRVHPDQAALARDAAERAAAVLREVVGERGSARAMFATGNSQLAFVDALTSFHSGDGERDVPWHAVDVFHMDEYVGVGPDHPAGFQRWIRERITERVHPRSAEYLDGLAGLADPEGECRRYTGLLSEGMDLVCLGIGENGHLAFNDPGEADFDDPLDVKVVTLDEACRAQQVGEGHFPDLDAVPAQAMTVTIPALLRAEVVLAIVPEGRKAQAVHDALTDVVSTRCPASVLRTRDNVTLYLDLDSSALLALP
ncbi:MAG TPA: glucosamine-6-phosphate deaminase [Acidimicrobiales bacterium]|nr:glucosamine-6-phosphate deaminase [Acidimicrobiales bacterium]